MADSRSFIFTLRAGVERYCHLTLRQDVNKHVSKIVKLLHLTQVYKTTNPSFLSLSTPPPPLPCLVQSMEDLEDQKRKKKKEKMTLGSLSRVFARGKQRKSLDPGLFDGTATPDYYIEEDADW